MNAFDISQNNGSNVYATHDGTVYSAISWGSGDLGYGNHVIISSTDGSFYTLYGHLLAFYVTPGQIVSAGTLIGVVDNTGNSTGPHLHYELRTGSAASSQNQCDLVNYVPPGWSYLGTTNYAGTCYARDSGGASGP